MKSLIHVTDWERVSMWRRILGAFVRVSILLTLLTFLTSLLGPPISIFLTARWEARRLPGVKVAPQPLSDYSVSDAPRTVLSYFGYEFDVPWNAGFKEKVFGKAGRVQLEFQSGQNVTFIVPENQGGLLTELVQDESMHMKNLQVVFGDLMNRSAYDQYAALLNTTPSTIRAFGPRAEAARGMTLLTIKAIAVGPGLETEVFGMNGHYVEIICVASKDGVRLLQPEVNLILTSLRATAPESSLASPPRLTAPPK